MAEPVRIYTTRRCGYCVMAKRLMDSLEWTYTEIDVSGDHEARGWLIQETGRRTVPQIFVGDRAIGGYTDLLALHRAGQLEQLFTGT